MLLLTNDGELTNHLIHPRYHVDKVYRLKILGKANASQLKALRRGVLLNDRITDTAKVKVINNLDTFFELAITIHEGPNRQIRRICETAGIKLLELKRIAFGPLHLEKMKEGAYRMLSKKEIALLKK